MPDCVQTTSCEKHYPNLGKSISQILYALLIQGRILRRDSPWGDGVWLKKAGHWDWEPRF
jgi:hypothetical protein